MPELIQTFKSMQKTEEEKRKFLASLQGINLNEEIKEVNVQGIKIEKEKKEPEQDIKELRKGFLDRFNK